jgi:hypothetical protein
VITETFISPAIFRQQHRGPQEATPASFPKSVLPAHSQVLDRIIAGQCRLLAARADAGLPLDPRSLFNLVRLCRDLALVETANSNS